MSLFFQIISSIKYTGTTISPPEPVETSTYMDADYVDDDYVD